MAGSASQEQNVSKRVPLVLSSIAPWNSEILNLDRHLKVNGSRFSFVATVLRDWEMALKTAVPPAGHGTCRWTNPRPSPGLIGITDGAPTR